MPADLHLVFSRDKSTRTLTITDPADNLTRARVLKAMENIVARKAILSSKQAVDGAKAAYHRNRADRACRLTGTLHRQGSPKAK